MTEDSKRQRQHVEQLLDQIEAQGWTVTNYDADVDPYTEMTVSIDVEINRLSDFWDSEQ